jgi:hypothetical protein
MADETPEALRLMALTSRRASRALQARTRAAAPSLALACLPTAVRAHAAAHAQLRARARTALRRTRAWLRGGRARIAAAAVCARMRSAALYPTVCRTRAALTPRLAPPQALPSSERVAILHRIADGLLAAQDDILAGTHTKRKKNAVFTLYVSRSRHARVLARLRARCRMLRAR